VIGGIAIWTFSTRSDPRLAEKLDPIPAMFKDAKLVRHEYKVRRYGDELAVYYELPGSWKDRVAEFNGRSRGFGFSPSGQAGYWVGINKEHGGRNLRLLKPKGAGPVHLSYVEFFGVGQRSILDRLADLFTGHGHP
jgi:hypothetical protein